MKKIEINWSKETKKKVMIGGIIVVIIGIISIIAFYIGNESFKTFFDRNILRKEIQENKVANILINTEESPKVYAYNNYITVLNKNKLISYSNLGEKKFEQEISVSDPIYSSNNRFLAVAQKNGQNLYLISEANMVWQAEVEGEIKKINVNKNGYISVILTRNSYKTVVVTYSPSGNELFTTYLATTTAIDTDISNDNKYLSIAEVNTTGTLIQSNIKIISIEKAQKDSANSVIYMYNAEANDLITNIKYQDKNKLVCMYDNSIHILQDEKDEKITPFEDNKITLASVEFDNFSMHTIEKSAGLFSSNTQVFLKNTQTQKENIYTAKSAVKTVKTYGDKVALNLGSEVNFINTNGWLIKKYISEQEIKDIVLSDKIGGIIYKDKIEIIDL